MNWLFDLECMERVGRYVNNKLEHRLDVKQSAYIDVCESINRLEITCINIISMNENIYKGYVNTDWLFRTVITTAGYFSDDSIIAEEYEKI